MSKGHPRDEEYFCESAPQLFRDHAGRYLMGLAQLFGAHVCGPLGKTKDHDFVDDRCKACGIQRKPHRYLID